LTTAINKERKRLKGILGMFAEHMTLEELRGCIDFAVKKVNKDKSETKEAF
jgi:hypothetical protein